MDMDWLNDLCKRMFISPNSSFGRTAKIICWVFVEHRIKFGRKSTKNPERRISIKAKKLHCKLVAITCVGPDRNE